MFFPFFSRTSFHYIVLTEYQQRDAVCQAKDPKDTNSVEKKEKKLYNSDAMQTKVATRVFCSSQMCLSCATFLKKTISIKLFCTEYSLALSLSLDVFINCIVWEKKIPSWCPYAFEKIYFVQKYWTFYKERQFCERRKTKSKQKKTI